MFNENQIIEHLCEYLTAEGYEIGQKLSTADKGIDVIAIHKDTRISLLIEAKGGTSSRKGSNRFGRPFTSSQIFDRVSKGLYTAMATAGALQENEVSCLALPDDEVFLRYLWPIKDWLRALGIEVFLVGNSGVRVYGS